MSVGVRLPQLQCNLNCRYCFLEPLRYSDAPEVDNHFEECVELVEEKGEGIKLFGGEPLMLSKDKLAELLRLSYENGKGANINTNGVLIDEDHLDMFEEYDASVGVSIDGPEDLNRLRWAGSLEKTRTCTRRTMSNIELLVERDIEVDVISVLSQFNAGSEKRLRKFKEFLTWLDELDIRTGDILYIRKVSSSEEDNEYILDPEYLGEVWVSLAKFFEEKPGLLRGPFTYMKRLIRGKSAQVPCFWKACDIKDAKFNLETVEAGNIIKKGCLMRGDRGFEPLATQSSHYGRYVDLFETPQEFGGCEGCRFYSICLGHCPNDGLGNDPRNRSRYCKSHKIIFEFYERILLEDNVQPFSRHPVRSAVEQKMVDSFKRGQNLTVQEAIKEVSPSYLKK